MPQAASYDRAGPVPPACGAPVSASDFRAAPLQRLETLKAIDSLVIDSFGCEVGMDNRLTDV